MPPPRSPLVSRTSPSPSLPLSLLLTLILSLALPTHAIPPSPSALKADVSVDGRTSTLHQIETADIGGRIPPTFSRNLIGNTSGFRWVVSRHFALKTDLPPAQATETLSLLEMALPHLNTIFGTPTGALGNHRMAFVFASSRETLIRAMISDDMHLLRLGGITQEGFWGAYQYAGSPYQNRYIILHELVHLYQYCLAGNTRQFYGFFIEGIADFLSSHVYNPQQKQLTVNVLDRAPMHNHLAAGIDEWHRRGRPTFSSLYESADTTRGLDVLMTAFLQSTAAWEQNWRIYCREILQSQPDVDPKRLSDRLIADLYGSQEDLDPLFDAWLQKRQPTFRQTSYGFDQHGEWLISQPAPTTNKPQISIVSSSGFDPFVCDYPRTLPPPQSTAARSCGKMIFEVDSTIGSDSFILSQGASFAKDMAGVPINVLATAAGHRIRPHFTLGGPPDTRRQPPTSRFPAHPALAPIYRAAWRLGSLAPTTLAIARDMLLADAAKPSEVPSLPPSELQRPAFWSSLANDVASCPAPATNRSAALIELSNSALAISIHDDTAHAHFTTPLIGKSHGTLQWLINEEPVATRRLAPTSGQRTALYRFPLPVDRDNSQILLRARVSLDWLDTPITLDASILLNPSIPNWEVLGPFPLPEPRLTHHVFEPETQECPYYTAADGTLLEWQPVLPPSSHPPQFDHLIHFARIFGRQANFSVAYARTSFESHQSGEAILALGAADGVEIWHNGEKIYTDLTLREWAPGNLCVPLNIVKGTNSLRIKSVHGDGLWFLSARIQDKDGGPWLRLTPPASHR